MFSDCRGHNRYIEHIFMLIKCIYPWINMSNVEVSAVFGWAASSHHSTLVSVATLPVDGAAPESGGAGAEAWAFITARGGAGLWCEFPPKSESSSSSSSSCSDSLWLMAGEGARKPLRPVCFFRQKGRMGWGWDGAKEVNLKKKKCWICNQGSFNEATCWQSDKCILGR